MLFIARRNSFWRNWKRCLWWNWECYILHAAFSVTPMYNERFLCYMCHICKLKETSSAPLSTRIVNKDLILTALHRTIARGLPFLAGWNSGDRYAICHHAKRWDHLKKLTLYLWSGLQLLLYTYLPLIGLRPAIRHCAFYLVQALAFRNSRQTKRVKLFTMWQSGWTSMIAGMRLGYTGHDVLSFIE